MEGSKKTCFRALLFAASLAFEAGPAAAQGVPAPAAPGAGTVAVLANACTDLRNYEVKRTPSISGGASASKARVWGVFDVSFATKPEWIDELTVTYSVMLFKQDANEADGEKKFNFFRVSVAYADVAKGAEHKAGAVLLPAALLRWGKPMGFAAQFTVDGQEVCPPYHQETGPLAKQAAWWANSNVTDGPATEKHEGYLLDRAKTPFALVNPDSYETSRE
ncbi:MAG: hypothetical protein IJ678_05305 [Kiritimatiellae bacterium]|nr:hypothetical protein [Kiritimatiellia bacterium]